MSLHPMNWINWQPFGISEQFKMKEHGRSLETQLGTACHTASNLLDALVAELTRQDQPAPAAPRPNAPHKTKLEQPSLFET